MVAGAGGIPVTRPSKVLETAALVSFAVFITNEFVRFVYVGALHTLTHGRTLAPATGWATWWAAVAAAIAFAIAFHYLVDMPTQRWIKRVRRHGLGSAFGAPAPADAAGSGLGLI